MCISFTTRIVRNKNVMEVKDPFHLNLASMEDMVGIFLLKQILNLNLGH